jgi:hypothetical protein
MTKSLIKHISPKELTTKSVKDFFDFIGMLSTKECLAYKNSTWNATVDWLEQALNSGSKELVQPLLLQEFNNFIDDSNTNEFTYTNESEKLAKFILLFCDTSKEDTYKKTLEALTDRLLNCNKYVYSNSEKVEKCLMIFSSMIGYLKSKLTNFIILIPGRVLFNLLLFLETDDSNFKCNSYQIVQNIYNQIACEILDFVIRKGNDSTNEVS